MFICFLLTSLHAAVTIHYDYDPSGRLLTARYSDGTSIAYVYDHNGNLLERAVDAIPDGTPEIQLDLPREDPSLQDPAHFLSSGINNPGSFDLLLFDSDSSAENLIFTVETLSPLVLSQANIQFVSEGFKRTLTLTPENNAIGEGLVKVTVTDETDRSTSQTFKFKVGFPSLSPVDSFFMTSGETIILDLQVDDDQTDPASLELTAASSNAAVLANDDLSVQPGASPGSRTLTLHHDSGLTGPTTIALSLMDDQGLETVRTFQVTVVGGTEPRFTITDREGGRGSEVVVPVSVSQFKDMLGFQMSFRWDPQIAEFLNAENLNLKDLSETNFGASQAVNGSLTLSWNVNDGQAVTLDDTTEIFGLRFRLNGQPGQSTLLEFVNAPTPFEAIRDNQGELDSVPLFTQNGRMTILNRVLIGGQIVYYASPAPVQGIPVELQNGGTTNQATDASGTFQFEAEAGRDYTLRPNRLDDVPIANGVSTLDILLIRRHILNPLNEAARLSSPFQILAADVSEDQSVTTLDILLIRRFILNPIDFHFFKAPEQSVWKFVRKGFQFENDQAPWNYEDSRSYFNLGSDQLHQDFDAVKLGDVSGDWTPVD